MFRALFCALSVLLFFLAMRHAYHLVNMGTDENFFHSAVSRLYVTEDIPVARMTAVSKPTFTLSRREYRWIRKGDLITKINGEPVFYEDDVRRALNLPGEAEAFRIEVQRANRLNYFIEFEVRAAQLPENFFWEIPPTVYVFEVPSGGASHRAGMMVGDLIHQINGRTFRNHDEADRLVRNTLRGQTVDYGIIRRGELLTLKVTMARFTIPFSLVLYVLVGFAWIGAGIFLGLLRAELKEARLLGLGLLLMGVSFLLYENRGLTHSELFPDITRQLSVLAFYFGAAVLLHASYYFPRARNDLLSNGWPRYTVYPLAALASIWSFFSGSWGMIPGVLILFSPHLAMRIRYRSGKTPEHRKLEQFIVYATLMIFAVTLAWFLTRDQMTERWNLVMRAVPAGLFLAAYLYTIMRFRLLGIQVRRGVQYLLITAAGGAFVLGVFLYLLVLLSKTDFNLFNVRLTSGNIEFLTAPPSPERQQQQEKFLVMVIALGFGIVMVKLGSLGHQYLRKKFYRTSYDYHKTSKELNELLSTRLNMTELARGIVTKLSSLMLLKQVGLIFFNEEGHACCREAMGVPPDDWRQFAREFGPAIANTLKRFKSELRVEYLPAAVRNTAVPKDFKYVVPIHSDDRLLGCLLVGEKLSEVTYRQEDFSFLSAITRQAAVAVENAFLYEKLAGQERIRHELELARRIQLSSLPQTAPTHPSLDIAGASRPAFEVGGDYYSYFYEDHHDLTLIVADVSGKGTSAALYMSKMQGIFSALYDSGLGPRDLLLKANPILYREMDAKSFVTAICGKIETKPRKLRLARAGHVPLIRYRVRSGRATMAMSPGLGLGLEADGVFSSVLEERELTFEPDDIFLFLTDGLTEAFNKNREVLGERRLMDFLETHAKKDARGIRDAILAEVSEFSGEAEQSDDQTLVVVKAR